MAELCGCGGRRLPVHEVARVGAIALTKDVPADEARARNVLMVKLAIITLELSGKCLSCAAKLAASLWSEPEVPHA